MISFLFGFVVVMFIVYKGLQISEANQQINPPTANNAMASNAYVAASLNVGFINGMFRKNIFQGYIV